MSHKSQEAVYYYIPKWVWDHATFKFKFTWIQACEVIMVFGLLSIFGLYLRKHQKKMRSEPGTDLWKEKLQNFSYYFRSQKKGSSFKLRFPEIQACIVFQPFFVKIVGLLRWVLCFKNKGKPNNMQQVDRRLPIVQPNFKNANDKIKYTWIGHSTAVISFGKTINFLIDPVFSDRCSPVQWLGPKRFRRPACTIKQLPKINSVLISHDHFDHLDNDSLRKLEKQFKPTFFAGLNSSDVLPKGANIVQLDWTQTHEHNIDGEIFKITFVPACHWGKRGLFDTNKRLWGGFVIQTPNKKKIFYSGDTGYCKIFQELGNVFGGFDLAILPIGAYQPRQILGPQHIDPSQAVKIHKQIRSKKSVGVHWGTFPLGNEHWCQARQDLQMERTKQGLKPDQFVTVSHGGSFTIDL